MARTRRVTKKLVGEDYSMNTPSELNDSVETPRPKFFTRIFLLLALIILVFLAYKNKDLFLAGMVDGQPIFSWELNSRMSARYGQQTLDEIINERLVLSEAAKKGITVTDKEIKDKIAEVEKSLGGQTTLPDALKQQGLTMEEFQKQIKLRLVVEKTLADKVKVSEKEIDNYLTSNKDTIATYAGSESASQRKYATDTLKQQKTSTEFEKWFNDLKAKAKISKFLR